jgi:hypothetical protein
VAKSKEPVNPFYVLLVLVGTLFLVTACAYGLMAARATHPAMREAREARPAERDGPQVVRDHALLTFLDRHGAELLTWELVALGIATTAAMGLDRYRWRRQIAREAPATGDAESQTEFR